MHRLDLYPLVCTIILEDVTKQSRIHDITNVDDFLENNAHLQGVPADVLQVCAQLAEGATCSQTRGAAIALANELAVASLSDDPGTLVPDPLIQWPVQVSH